MLTIIDKNNIVDNFTDTLINSLKKDIYNLLEINNDITPGILMDILIGSHISSLFNQLETLKNGVPYIAPCVDALIEAMTESLSIYGKIEKSIRDIEKAH